MDSDLSLTEILGEDDSLLQQMPNEEACSVYSSSSFSPLCSFRPPKPSPRTLGLMGTKDSETPSSSCCGEIVNKENVNLNKPVMPKLSIEPQQMKKKKKGGGYNLRKSLAWDKAFFTEEGVLDPIELSMISGNLNSLGGEKLSVIHEEGRESLPEVPEQQNDSTNILGLEEKLFKNLPVKAKSGSKRPVGFSPQKHNGLAKNNGPVTSTAKRRVLSAQDVNMSGSKGSGCARPTTSSSLKKSVNINTTKGAAKELKVLRMPSAQADSGLANSLAKRSTPGGHLKRAQPIRAPVAEKNIRVQGSLSSTKTAANRAITGPGNKFPTSKSTLPQAKRLVGKVAAKLSSSTHTKAASERLQDQVNPPISHVPGGHRGDSSTVEALLPQNPAKLDGHMPNMPIQTAKPSGLRMPSPSIRFFDQPKSSTSQNLVKKYIQHCSIPQPTSSIPNKSNSVKTVQDIRLPLGHDQLQKLVSNSPSGRSSVAFTALTSLSASSHAKSDGLYGMQKTEQPQNGLIDEISSKQQDLHNIPSDGGEQDREFVEPCEPDKQLPPDEGNVKLNEDKLPTSIKPCCKLIKDEDKKHTDIPSESKDPDLGSSVDTQANSDVGFMLQTEDICLAIVEETSELSSETPSSLCHQSQSANNSFSVNQNILTLVNQTGSSTEPHRCVCAKNADCISKYNKDTAGEAERSKVQDDSPGSKDGNRRSHVEYDESPVHDNDLAISGPMEGKNVLGNFIVETETLGCQNMDHSLSATRESLIGSQGSYTGLQLRNDAQLCGKTNDLNEELPLFEDDGQSKGVTDTSDSDNPCASLSGVVFSKMEMEAGHSMSLLTSIKDENGPEIGYLTEHENMEENQYHPLDQKISQDISSPTTRTEVHCFDETLTGYFKGKPNSDSRNMSIVQLQTVGSGVGDADCYQTPVEDEYTDRADGEVIDAYGTNLKMKFVQQNSSYDILLSNSAAMDEIVTASYLDEQSDGHPDLQDCLVVDDHPTNKGLFMDDNSLHESIEKNFDNGGYESELTKCIEPLGAEPDARHGPDVVEKKAEKHDAQNMLSDVMIHDDNASHLDTKLEVGVSLEVTDEKILKSPTAADGNKTYPSSEAIHFENSRSHMEVDLPMDHCTPDVQLQYHSESTSHPTEQGEARVPQERCKDSQEQNGLLIKPPTYAPPFSDEWLAAIEAAGEEILTMKGGAVQNSPPDKTVPEPGPWSPVKKKHNQGIGPFDCTKFTNTAKNIPHSSPQ